MQERKSSESGTIMLEGVFGVMVSIIIMMMLLAMGFYLYQRTVFKIVSNQVAEAIVQTYKYKEQSDPASITLSDIDGVGKYRFYLFSSEYRLANVTKANAAFDKRMKKTSLAKDKGVKLNTIIQRYGDDIGRMHYEVTFTREYNFLFEDLLKYFGLTNLTEMKSTVYVDSVDFSYYANTIKCTNYGLNKIGDSSSVLKCFSSVVSLVGSIYKWGE